MQYGRECEQVLESKEAPGLQRKTKRPLDSARRAERPVIGHRKNQ